MPDVLFDSIKVTPRNMLKGDSYLMAKRKIWLIYF